MKRLKLNKKTVAILSNQDAKEILGGAAPTKTTQCPDTTMCEYTQDPLDCVDDTITYGSTLWITQEC